jgi:ATP-binding protein involved in chromosome partitioning
MAGVVTEEQVLQALRGVIDPDLRPDIVSLNMIRDLAIADSTVSFRFVLTTPACPVRDDMQRMAREAVAGLPGVQTVNITMDAEVPRRGTQQQNLLPGVRSIVAIASGKGGVGKRSSTTGCSRSWPTASSSCRSGSWSGRTRR